MFFLSLSRVLKFSLQNFARNIWLSLVTITIIVLTLFSVTSLIFVNAVTDKAIELVKDKVDVSVYFRPAVSQDQVFTVQKNLETLPYVAKVIYVSKADALGKLRQQYQDSPLLAESLSELGNNPLGDTLVVEAVEPADYQKIMDMLTVKPEYAALIESKSFDDNRFVIEKLQKFSGQARGVVLASTVFFGLVAILVIINTIRIAVYTHRDEVSIMKLVGASNAFVRGPFLGEAVIYAFLGTALTTILTYFFTVASAPYVSGLFGQSNFNLMAYWQAHIGRIFFGELAATAVVSLLATIFALRRYLKV